MRRQIRRVIRRCLRASLGGTLDQPGLALIDQNPAYSQDDAMDKYCTMSDRQVIGADGKIYDWKDTVCDVGLFAIGQEPGQYRSLPTARNKFGFQQWAKSQPGKFIRVHESVAAEILGETTVS